MNKVKWSLAALALVAACAFKLASDPWVQKQIPHAAPTASVAPVTPSPTPRPSARPLNDVAAAYIAAAEKAAAASAALDAAAAENVTAAAAASAADPSYDKTIADAVAQGLCTGTLSVAYFTPDSGVDQATIDRHARAYTAEQSTCDEVAYLGDVPQSDSTDFIYRIVTKGKANWYVFTVNGGLVSNIQ